MGRGGAMPPNRGRAAPAAGAADPRLAALLAWAGMGGRGFEVRALPGGFANAVWRVDTGLEAPGLGHRRVAKVFSELSRRRASAGDSSWGDVALKRGGLDSLGAGLVYASREGVVHEWLPGNSLSLESLLAEGEPLLECMAVRLAQLHGIRLPRQARALFWGWLRSMSDVAFRRGTRPCFGTGRETLEREVAWAEAEVARAELGSPLVFCHGDLKPDNVIRVANEHGGADAIDLRFIDLELAGPNWRGLDVAKLFRAGTGGENTRPLTFEEGSECERALRAFVGHYCLASGVGDPERLVLEAKALLPLTWLEAHLFFRAALSLETCSTRQETLSELAEHRWECYLGTRAALSSYSAELRRG